MVNNKHREMGIPGGLALGLLVSVVTTLGCIAALAWLIAGGRIGEGSNVVIWGIQLISAALGSLTAMLCVRKLRLQICLLSGLTYYLTLLGITALFYDGAYDSLIVPAVMVMIGSWMIAFFPSRKNHAGKRRKRAYR